MRFQISTLMLLTAAIAVGLGLGRTLLQSRAQLEIERALEHCHTIRVQCPRRSPHQGEIITWDITKPETIDEVRTLLDIPSAREDPTDTVIMGGPAIEVTVLQNGREAASFRVVASLLTAPAYPEYQQRRYLLPSDEAWNLLLELSEPRR